MKLRQVDGQSPNCQAIPTALPKLLIVDIFVHELAVHHMVILRLLIFNMDQCLLPAAESKVLQAGQLEIILLKFHPESPAPIHPEVPA